MPVKRQLVVMQSHWEVLPHEVLIQAPAASKEILAYLRDGEASARGVWAGRRVLRQGQYVLSVRFSDEMTAVFFKLKFG